LQSNARHDVHASAVVVLLGAISLTRLPVDLMPEFAQPRSL
jgi:multidrug efflux pump subunit AcrB